MKKFLLLALVLASSSAYGQRLIRGNDVTGALGYRPVAPGEAVAQTNGTGVNTTLTNPAISGGRVTGTTIVTQDARTRDLRTALWTNEYGYLLAPLGWPLETCPVGNCPIPGQPGYGGAYGGPTLSGYWMRGQSSSAQHPQFLSNIGLYVKDDGTKLGQYVTQYLGAMQGPTAGPTWSLNTDIVRGACGGGVYSFGGEPGSGIPFGDPGCSAQPGSLGQVATYGYEMDVNNLEGDTDQTGATVQGLFINVTHSRYTSGDGIFLSGDPAMGVKAWHNGLTFSTNAVKDRSIFDYSTSETSYVVGGAHANAAFYDVSNGRFSIRLDGIKSEADIHSGSTSPAFLANTTTKSAAVFVETSNSSTVFSIEGSHGNAGYNDKSTTPAALALSGNYSVAAIYTGSATTQAAVVTAPGQQICLGGGGVACFVYNPTTQKVYLSTNGVNLWSIDASGHQIVRNGTSTGEP